MSELILRLKGPGDRGDHPYGELCRRLWASVFPRLFLGLTGGRKLHKTHEAYDVAESFDPGLSTDTTHEAGSMTGGGENGQNTREGSPEPSMERAEKAFDRYGNAILRLAYSYLHNMSDAEDILQETLIRYMKAAPDLHGEEHEKAWLLHVSANLCKNRIKYNKYRETDELMEELVAEKKEDLSFVWEAVRSLPEKYREVIHLFYQETLTTKEIAEGLGRKEATIRSDLLRGREKLKKILKEAYDFE